jgi:hypothetical protein
MKGLKMKNKKVKKEVVTKIKAKKRTKAQALDVVPVKQETTPIPTEPTFHPMTQELVNNKEVLFSMDEVEKTVNRMVEVVAKNILDIIQKNIIPVKGPMRKDVYFINLSAINQIKKEYGIS